MSHLNTMRQTNATSLVQEKTSSLTALLALAPVAFAPLSLLTGSLLSGGEPDATFEAASPEAGDVDCNGKPKNYYWSSAVKRATMILDTEYGKDGPVFPGGEPNILLSGGRSLLNQSCVENMFEGCFNKKASFNLLKHEMVDDSNAGGKVFKAYVYLSSSSYPHQWKSAAIVVPELESCLFAERHVKRESGTRISVVRMPGETEQDVVYKLWRMENLFDNLHGHYAVGRWDISSMKEECSNLFESRPKEDVDTKLSALNSSRELHTLSGKDFVVGKHGSAVQGEHLANNPLWGLNQWGSQFNGTSR